MKTLIYKSNFSFLLLIAFFVPSVFGQQVKVNPFSIQPSTLLEDLRAIKSSNPKMATAEFVKTANTLLQKQGLNFPFSFDADVCQKIEEVRRKQKDPNSPVTLNARLNSFEGDQRSVVLPTVKFEAGEAGKCSVLLPLFEITQNDFITTIQNRTVKFYRPKNFIFNDVILVDNQTLKSNLRIWKTPFCTTPLAVSEDGRLLYLNLPGGEFDDIILIIYDEGTFQFYAKNDVDLTVKGALLANAPKDLNLPDKSFLAFGSGEKQRVLKFNAACEKASN